ncbi:MAG: ABC transporter permease [Phycisphaera sp.]|nr:ABC transporter permease [Phycisphaera sp.]
MGSAPMSLTPSIPSGPGEPDETQPAVNDSDSTTPPAAERECEQRPTYTVPTRKPSCVIKPRRGFAIDLSEIWRFRDLMGILVTRNIKVRYKQTVLGSAWAIIQPVTEMVVFTVFFGMFMGLSQKMPEVNGRAVPYAVFVFAGSLVWTLFQSSVNASSMSLISESNVLRKVYLPRILLPVSAVGTPLVDFAVAFAVLIVLMIGYSQPFHASMLLMPLVMVGTAVSALSIGLLFAAVMVRYRDVRYIVPVVIRLWFFVTPVLYPVSAVPRHYEHLLYLNPMVGPVEAARAMVLGTPINTAGWMVSTLVGLIFTVMAIAYFGNVEREFADIA